MMLLSIAIPITVLAQLAMSDNGSRLASHRRHGFLNRRNNKSNRKGISPPNSITTGFSISSAPKEIMHRKPEGKFYEHLSGHRGSRRSHYIKVPYVDANGCSRAGEVVCTADNTNPCDYRVCVLADESLNLWKKPTFDVVTEACPAGRGLSSTFCNNNERLLRSLGVHIIGNRQHGGGHHHYGHHHHHHHKNQVVSKDPCIVTNAGCTGTVRDVIAPLPQPDPTITEVVEVEATTTIPSTALATAPSTTQPPTTTQPPATTRLPPPLPTQPQDLTTRDSGCPDPYLRIANRHSQGGALVSGTVNTEEECKRYCMQQPTCRAIDFDHTRQRCFTYTEFTQTCMLPIQDSIVDHYLKTSCQQHAGAVHGIDDCFPGYNVNGATPKINIKSMKACQLQCSLDPSCQGIDFDSATACCWFHSYATVCGKLNPSKTVQHCRRVNCGTKKPDLPVGFSQASIGFQQKGGIHLTKQYSRHGCLQTCVYSELCAAVDYNIEDGSCWHIASNHACGPLFPVPQISNYRKQVVKCKQTQAYRLYKRFY